MNGNTHQGYGSEMRSDVPDLRRGIRGSLEQTEKLLAVLGEVVQGLTDRVDLILLPDMREESAKSVGEDGSADSPLLAQILSINSRIARRTEDISSLSTRIQL